MTYKLIKVRAKRSNYGDKRKLSDIDYLVYHYTGNDGDSAKANSNYITNDTVYVSAHYFVDDLFVYKSVPQKYIAWHCGHDKGGQYYHEKCRNYNSIGIEMCDTKKDGKHNLTIATRKNAIALGTKIVKKRGISQKRVVRHYDVTHKRCPSYFVADPIEWARFRAELFGGFKIGQTIELKRALAVRKTCGGKKTKEVLKAGTKCEVFNSKWSKNGNLYIRIGKNRWVLAIKEGKRYVL